MELNVKCLQFRTTYSVFIIFDRILKYDKIVKLSIVAKGKIESWNSFDHSENGNKIVAKLMLLFRTV